MRYSSNPGKAAEKKLNTIYNTRTTVGSMFRYSAIPPQTPAKMRLLERYNFFILVLLIYKVNSLEDLLIVDFKKIAFEIKD